MALRGRDIASVALRWLLGALFIFSGAVKCVDPVGTSIYVEKYLATYGLDFMLPAAEVVGVALSVVEFSLGVLLIVGLWRRVVALITLILLSLFGLITLLSATLLPIGDCGCFGSVLILTPWQTLLKNILSLPVAWYVWHASRCDDRVDDQSGDDEPSRGHVWRYGVLLISVALPLCVSLYAHAHLPLVDVSPYRVGVNLRAAVTAERDMVAASSRSVLIFRDVATGEEVESEVWLESGYEYVDARVVSDDVATTYDDMLFYDAEGVDHSMAILSRSGRVALLCINDAQAMEHSVRGLTVLLSRYPANAIVVLSAAGAVDNLSSFTIYGVDAMTLRTMLRADVGVIILNDGVVEFKANIRDVW